MDIFCKNYLQKIKKETDTKHFPLPICVSQLLPKEERNRKRERFIWKIKLFIKNFLYMSFFPNFSPISNLNFQSNIYVGTLNHVNIFFIIHLDFRF